MRRVLSIIAAAGVLTTGAARADPAIHALFVGVNHYAYGDAHPGETDFKNLNGALNDVALVKTALAKTYKIAIDTPPAKGVCETPGGVTVTLLDQCATRVRIMAALQGAVDASRKGDLVLFYFAGHGSRLADPANNKPSGLDSTILQSDARVNMNDPNSGDIMGTELNTIINAASLKGVNVVTIFNSCNSQGATRSLLGDVGERYAPNLVFPPGVEHRPVLTPGPRGSGYVVHLAAAADDSVSHESPMSDGRTHGAFSFALAQALLNAPNTKSSQVSYQDVFDETKRNIASLGYPGQKPMFEGDVTATFLGRRAVSTRVVAVNRGANGELLLAGGSLSGVEAGSIYGLFGSNAEAASDALPADTPKAIVASPVGPYSAPLKADPSSPAPANPTWARELEHKYSAQGLIVEIRAADPELDTTIRGLLSDPDLTLVRIKDANVQAAADPGRAQYLVVADAQGVHIRAADGTQKFDTLDPKSSTFTKDLTTDIKHIAAYETLLSLRKGASDAQPTIVLSAYDQDGREVPAVDGALTVKKGLKASVILRSQTPTPRLLYLFVLDETTFDIDVLYPRRSHQSDWFDQNGQADITDDIDWAHDTAGPLQLLLIGSSQEIDADAFRQGTQAASRGIASSPLQTLLLSAKTGKRGLNEPAATTWGAAIATINIVE